MKVLNVHHHYTLQEQANEYNAVDGAQVLVAAAEWENVTFVARTTGGRVRNAFHITLPGRERDNNYYSC